MKKLLFNFILVSLPVTMMAQGLVNDNAYIVMADGATMTITGGTNGNYKSQNGGIIKSANSGGVLNLEGNWINNSSNEAFSNDGITVQLTGNNAQSIGGTYSSSFYNLKLLGSSGLKSLGTNSKVGGIADFDGVLSLGDRVLDLNTFTLEVTNSNPNAITRGAGYIISENDAAKVQWKTEGPATYVYTFGASGDYLPITVERTTAGTSNLSVSTRATGSDNLPLVTGVTNLTFDPLGNSNGGDYAVDRWYDISSSNAITANLTLAYRGAENTTTSASPLSIQHWDGSEWETPQGSNAGVTSGVGYVTATGFTDFSPFLITTLENVPLPVTLTDFSVSCDLPSTTIKWTTASENNSDEFVLRKSRDLQNWSVVSVVPANGNSSQTIHYEVIDNSPLSGTFYYSLVQRDMDGKEEVYGPISTTCNEVDTQNSLTIFPNPTSQNFSVEIMHNEDAEEANIRLVDLTGKIVEQRSTLLNKGTNQINFNASGYAPGTYLIKVESKSNYAPAKLIVY